jgi:hypothetical protein
LSIPGAVCSTGLLGSRSPIGASSVTGEQPGFGMSALLLAERGDGVDDRDITVRFRRAFHRVRRTVSAPSSSIAASSTIRHVSTLPRAAASSPMALRSGPEQFTAPVSIDPNDNAGLSESMTYFIVKEPHGVVTTAISLAPN